MKILDPGHKFLLTKLDDKDFPEELTSLTFVKREGENYPGNIGHYPGTTLQEVYRACIGRHIYLDKQIHSNYNEACIVNLRDNIMCLELRAAERHKRVVPKFTYDIENMIVCPKCMHIGCEGNCHADR